MNGPLDAARFFGWKNEFKPTEMSALPRAIVALALRREPAKPNTANGFIRMLPLLPMS